MTVHPTSQNFKENARQALADPQLQRALGHVKSGFIGRRAGGGGPAAGIRGAARRRARHQEPHARPSRPLSRELRGEGHGGRRPRAFRARRPTRRATIVLDHLPDAAARSTVTKGKSMIAEEIGLNDASRGGTASRRSRPISANTSSSCATRCRATSSPRPCTSTRARSRPISAACTRISTRTATCREPVDLLTEARAVLREKFLAADVGITGANFLIAETGTSIIVTNEGNGDLTQTLPKAHIVLASIEKLVPTLEDVEPDPARPGALGDRPGHVRLHDVLDRPAPRRRSGRARQNITSSCSTTAARPCSAPSSRTCCAASAAAPA